MKYIYIACPYSIGNAELNVHRCIMAAEVLSSHGHIPFAPLLFHYWEEKFPHPYDFWIKQSMAWLERCDAVIRLPGESKGADAEVLRAIEIGLPVYNSMYQFLHEKETRDVSNRSSVGSDSSQDHDSRGSAGV